MLRRGYAGKFTLTLVHPVVGDVHVVEVPGLGDSISEGRVLDWVIPIGGKVNAHDTIASLETEKITQPVNAPVSGTVSKFLANPGDDVCFAVMHSVTN
jgi:pyruvate/2-oxoglutarate dehydrogenase complex dihydrolipoamide acyltransferase (E2) component